MAHVELEAAAKAELEAALSAACRAALPLPAKERPAFVSEHLIAQADRTNPPVLSSDTRIGTAAELRAELTALSELLTAAVRSARGKVSRGGRCVLSPLPSPMVATLRPLRVHRVAAPRRSWGALWQQRPLHLQRLWPRLRLSLPPRPL